jgi:multidrug efflux pump subunit AcrB
MNDDTNHSPPRGAAGRLAAAFVDSKLTPLLIVGSVLLGLASVILLPREEEPQIQVPMIDVMVAMPGASAAEVEERVTRPMEQLLWEIPGVEYLYSTSAPGESLAIVRFAVGSDVEASLVKLNQKLQSNFDRIPHGASQPLIKPRSIDDVPILALTFHSAERDPLELRQVAAQFNERLKGLPQVAETTLIGGARRQVRVTLDPARLAARGLALDEVAQRLAAANWQERSGRLISGNLETIVDTGSFFRSAEEIGLTVLATPAGRPVFLRDVAEIVDGPEDPVHYAFFVPGPTLAESDERIQNAVTLSLAKRPGANAIAVVHRALDQVERLKPLLLPADVSITVTRDYGETAAEKSNELLFHMAIAVVGVSLLILFFLGWRESLVVAVAIPTTLSLTLLVFYLYGYTLNRITLFALIFSIGILVDDAIVVVENIVRHRALPANRNRSLLRVGIEAVDEVGNPTILATLAVIAAIVPMAFVGGLMGPYMRPIPIGASAAMLFSLAIAFMVTPWAAVRLLRGRPADAHAHAAGEGQEDRLTRLYRAVMRPLLEQLRWRWLFLGTIALLLLAALGLVGIGWVKVKMLPFDNKSEFQVILNMPEGSTLEQTAAVARELAESIRHEPEIRDIQLYAGTAAPFNFNGLVRHYFLRRGAAVADLQVNLVPRQQRSSQSHSVAKRLREPLTAVAARHGAALAVAEVPPGPPVLQTLVAEVYAPDEQSRYALAEEVRQIFLNTPDVVDVDWYVEAIQPRARLQVDREKAALHGLDAQSISGLVTLATEGRVIGRLHDERAREDVPLRLETPRSVRTAPEDLLSLHARSSRLQPDAPLVPLRELVRIEQTDSERHRYHKNLLPVVYITADVAGAAESPAYAVYAMTRALQRLDARAFGGQREGVDIYHVNQPLNDLQPSVKWDGEWHITIEVFRDLGLAFAAVLVLIYALMVGWFRSFVTPWIVMAAIPFSLIGIMPAHAALGAFFTATSMIGFMAGAGIVVRNSIILVDFIELRRRDGMALADAVVEAGAVRFRPMLLTALAVVVGASVILADPIFQGLAIALMAGEIASLLISRMAVPVLYYMANHRSEA